MNLSITSLIVMSMIALGQASQSKKTNDNRLNPGNMDDYDFEMWRRWRGMGRGMPPRDNWIDDEYERRDRRSRWERPQFDGRRREDGIYNGRDDPKRNDKYEDSNNNTPQYPPKTPNSPPFIPNRPPTDPSYPGDKRRPPPYDYKDHVSSYPVMTTVLPPLPIIIEPIMITVIVPSETKYGHGSVISSSYGPVISSSYGSPTSSSFGISSSYGSSPIYTTPLYTLSMKHALQSYSTNSTSIHYYSTAIVTEAESTVTTKVTGRYRAMSNAANTLAGSISFTIVLFSSIFLISLI